MRIDGCWVRDDDGEVRPVFEALITTPEGQQVSIEFLLDTGADSVILAPNVLQQLGATAQPVPIAATANGVGGMIALYKLDVDLVLFTTTGQRVRVHGPLPIALEAHALDRSVLGRNFTNQFTLVCSQSQNIISLLSPPDAVLIQ